MKCKSRRNDIVLRAGLKSARIEIADVCKTTTDVKQHLTLFSTDITTQVTRVRSELQSSSLATSTALSSLDRSVQSGELKLGHVQASINVGTKAVEITTVTLIYQTIFERQANQIIFYQQQQQSFSKIFNQLETLLSHVATISLKETETHDFILEGKNLADIVLPLTLMRSDLIKATKSLRANPRLQLSASEAGWLTDEVEKLLASGYEEAAAELRRKSARSCKASGSQLDISSFVKNPTREPCVAVLWYGPCKIRRLGLHVASIRGGTHPTANAEHCFPYRHKQSLWPPAVQGCGACRTVDWRKP
jgi:hypothetical protein